MRQYPEWPKYYAFAGAFVHASTTQQWGLVVNEAMVSGLPVLVSERCGCVTENGRKGLTFDLYEVNELGDLMEKTPVDDCERAAMGKASLEIISRWAPETFAAGLEQAIEAALAARARKVFGLDRAFFAALGHR